MNWILDAARLGLMAALFIGAVWLVVWLSDRSDR